MWSWKQAIFHGNFSCIKIHLRFRPMQSEKLVYGWNSCPWMPFWKKKKCLPSLYLRRMKQYPYCPTCLEFIFHSLFMHASFMSSIHNPLCASYRICSNYCLKMMSKDIRYQRLTLQEGINVSVEGVCNHMTKWGFRRPHSTPMTESRMKPRNSDHLSCALSTNDTAYS